MANSGTSVRFVLLHYHIYKNAGTTIEEILDRNFGERLCRFDSADRDASISNEDLLALLSRERHLEAVSSHQIRYPVPAAAGFLFFDICFLRDPLDRIRSMYDYAREKPAAGDPVSDLANRLTLACFVEHLLEHMPQHVTNVQVNLLAGPDELSRATQTVLNASSPGVVDCFEKSLAAARHFLNPVFAKLDCGHAPVNVSKGLERTLAERKAALEHACGPRLYAELVSRNALDLELVERARAEVDRRFRLASEEAAFGPPEHKAARNA